MVSSIFKISVLAAFCAAANAIAIVPRQAITRDQIASLAPDLGSFPNTNPNRFGDCDGPPQANGQIPRVPCPCPPLRDAFIDALFADIQAGHAVNNTVVKMSFPLGDSVQDKHGRITASIIALQNLNGPGKGCPGVSTTLGIQSNNLDKCGDFFCGDQPPPASSVNTSTSTKTTSSAAATTSAPPIAQPNPTQAPVNVADAETVTVTSIKVITSIVTVTAGETPAASNTQAAAAPPPPADTTSSSAAAATTTAATGNGQVTRDLVAQLAPDLGSHPNNNRNASGDCDGPKLQDGSIKKVPCACPPERDAFIDALFADIQAGHAIHNPGVKVDFPTGDSKQDKHARITAATIALQNLNGPGQGCPFVSTTFGAQSDAIDRS